MQYCTKCGKKSTTEYVFLQLSSLIRMKKVHNAGFQSLRKNHDNETMEIFEYDIMQTEIVELTCILEKILRDFYMDIAHIVYKTNQVEYIERLIEKSTNNDFIQILINKIDLQDGIHPFFCLNKSLIYFFSFYILSNSLFCDQRATGLLISNIILVNFQFVSNSSS